MAKPRHPQFRERLPRRRSLMGGETGEHMAFSTTNEAAKEKSPEPSATVPAPLSPTAPSNLVTRAQLLSCIDRAVTHYAEAADAFRDKNIGLVEERMRAGERELDSVGLTLIAAMSRLVITRDRFLATAREVISSPAGPLIPAVDETAAAERQGKP